MPSRPSFLTKPSTRLIKAFARAPRGPIEDKTKGTNRELCARVAASIRGLRIIPISASQRRAPTRPRMSSPRLRMAESPVRQVMDTSTRTHTPEGPKPNRPARQVDAWAHRNFKECARTVHPEGYHAAALRLRRVSRGPGPAANCGTGGCTHDLLIRHFN